MSGTLQKSLDVHTPAQKQTGAKAPVHVIKNKLFVHNVHSYFEAETHFGSSWFSPHSHFSFILNSF